MSSDATQSGSNIYRATIPAGFAYAGAGLVAARQARAFRARLKEAGFEPHVSSRQSPRQVWEKEQEILAQWIQRAADAAGAVCLQPRPRGVRNLHLVGLHVPEIIAVLGVDNDDVFCELSDPPLSSVALNTKRRLSGSRLLDGLMSGHIRKPRRIIVEAVGVVFHSVDEVIAVKDYDMAAALQFIRREQGKGISVNRVADEVAMSQRGPQETVPRNDRPDNSRDPIGAAGACQKAVAGNDVSRLQGGGDFGLRAQQATSSNSFKSG